jgi:hypothetical protein
VNTLVWVLLAALVIYFGIKIEIYLASISSHVRETNKTLDLIRSDLGRIGDAALQRVERSLDGTDQQLNKMRQHIEEQSESNKDARKAISNYFCQLIDEVALVGRTLRGEPTFKEEMAQFSE